MWRKLTLTKKMPDNLRYILPLMNLSAYDALTNLGEFKMQEEKKEMKKEKNYQGYIVLDYFNGAMRIMKTKPTKLSPRHIAIKLDLTIVMPEEKEIVAKGRIEMTEKKVKELFVEAI